MDMAVVIVYLLQACIVLSLSRIDSSIDDEHEPQEQQQ